MALPVEQTIKRDPALFYWILLPITVVMILTGILRHYLSILIQSQPKPPTLPKLREQRSLMRGVNLRNNSHVLPRSSFRTRRDYLVSAYKEGKFLAEPDKRGKPKGNPLSDPAAMDGMMGMMKGNVAMMVPQTLIMGWINAFFAGFVLLKLPFPLTPQFKSMLQSGVGTRDLDVSQNAANQMAMQMQQMNPTAGGFGPEQDPDKLFLAEAENLEVLDHKCILDDVEDRLLAKHGM